MPDNTSDSIFVVDTSVLVHDPLALRTFHNTEVAIPIFVVMELDDLKNSRRHEVASSARIASRFISELRQYGELNAADGVLLPENGTRYRIIGGSEGSSLDSLERAASSPKMDLLILDSALTMRPLYETVTLVSKDVNLRLLASFEGLAAQDYDQDRVSISEVYTGYQRLKDVDPELIGLAYVPDGKLTPQTLGVEELLPNEFIVIEEELSDLPDEEPELREHLLRCYADSDGQLRPVPRELPRWVGIQPRNVEQRMAMDLMLDPEVELITLVGKAGTGKTFLALAAAMALLLERGNLYERVLISKPVISMGKDVGFLPGDFETKMQPWMMSFFDNLDQLFPPESGALAKGATRDARTWETLFDSRQLEIQAIATIRGRSISKAFMLIDEAQNLTPHEVKTIITRAANGTKVILAGDPFQVDNPFLDQHTNGLTYVAERLKSSALTGSVFFTRGERSRLAELAATQL